MYVLDVVVHSFAVVIRSYVVVKVVDDTHEIPACHIAQMQVVLGSSEVCVRTCMRTCACVCSVCVYIYIYIYINIYNDSLDVDAGMVF